MLKQKDLTFREDEILKFINSVISKRGFAPSIREIGQGVGLSSPSTVHNYLTKLEKKGFIKRNRLQPRTIEISRKESTITYLPIIIEEETFKKTEETFAIDSKFLGSSSSFLLKIKTDAFKRAGIFPGDYLIVNEQDYAHNDELIVCEVDGEILLRRYYKGSSYITLDAENNLLKPIFIKKIKILGKVQGLIRKMEKEVNS